MKTQTEVAVKPRAKPRAKATVAAKAAKLTYASLYLAIKAGELGDYLALFYKSADAYHAKRKTAFPRERNAAVALLTPEEGKEFLLKYTKTGLPPANPTGQRLYDEMRVAAAKLA